ncbi:hypothetical protein [Bacillus paranthracis]|uniref:hypothetical protein n=1 Tax=Bacillus paranthracis TaxID=2026186 RepID=UPI0018792A24|nr:hypothetical protein [Bacillus paranthracis]
MFDYTVIDYIKSLPLTELVYWLVGGIVGVLILFTVFSDRGGENNGKEKRGFGK